MVREFRPVTWIIVTLLLGLLVTPVFFLTAPPEPEPKIDLLTPPDVTPLRAAPEPQNKPAQNADNAASNEGKGAKSRGCSPD